MQTRRPTLVSEEGFLSLPESMEKIELIDGEVIMSPAPNTWHQELLLRIVFALRSWAQRAAPTAFVGISPLDVRFGPDRILQPDAIVVLSGVSLQAVGPIDRIPDLCIEVLSSNRAYDRLTKRHVYAEAGVSEYWVVEPSGVVERWFGPGLGQSEVCAERLATSLLPGFELDLSELFRQS